MYGLKLYQQYLTVEQVQVEHHLSTTKFAKSFSFFVFFLIPQLTRHPKKSLTSPACVFSEQPVGVCVCVCISSCALPLFLLIVELTADLFVCRFRTGWEVKSSLFIMDY